MKDSTDRQISIGITIFARRSGTTASEKITRIRARLRVLFDSSGPVSRSGRFRAKTDQPRLGFANAAANKHTVLGTGTVNRASERDTGAGIEGSRYREGEREREREWENTRERIIDSEGQQGGERANGRTEGGMERETSAIGLAVNSGDTSGWLGWFRIRSKPALTTLLFDGLPKLRPRATIRITTYLWRLLLPY